MATWRALSPPEGSGELVALAQLGTLDRQASAARQRLDYEDATQFTEQWANLAAWNVSVAGALQVSGGRVYAATNGATMGGNRALALGASGSNRARILSSIVVPAAVGSGGFGSAGLAGIGVTLDAAGAAPTSANIVMFGVEGAANQFFVFNKGAFANSGADFSAVAAGTYYLAILADEENVSLVLTNAARTVERRYTLKRAAVGTINNVTVWNSDSRDLTGIAVGAVQAKLASATVSPRVVEGQADTVALSYLPGSSTERIRVALPKTYDARRPAPVVLYTHGAGEDEAGPWTDTLKRTLINDLTADGYIVASANAHGDAWGNQLSLSDYLGLYRYVRDRFAIGPVLILAQSMGGLPGLLTLAGDRVPGIAGFAGIYPLTNFRAFWDAGDVMGTEASIRTAYGITNDADWEALTTGHRPEDKAPTAFRSVPFRFYASTADTVVPADDHSIPFAASIAPHVREANVVACSGDHGDPSHFQSADLRAFFARCIAA